MQLQHAASGTTSVALRQSFRSVWLALGLLLLSGPNGLLSGAESQPGAPMVLLQETPVGIAMLADGSYAFFNKNRPAEAVVLPTADGQRLRLEPRIAFELPAADRPAPNLLLQDEQGELHEVWLEARGVGRRIAVDRFIDIWHRRTSGNRTRWDQSQMIWRGYTGALMEYVRLETGRILVPFGEWIPSRELEPPTGASVVTAVYSDDRGRTWKQSPAQLTSPCYEGYNGNNYGACEPAVVQLEDGRIWMLMRTQAGFLYESSSPAGIHWKPAAASRFHASTGPPGLTKLPDGRIVLFWNNCEMPPRLDGAGVYGGRDALHAAISDDGGKTWRGFREVYRDMFRNQTPPKSGDRGTAYPFGTFDRHGKIVLLSGQGQGRRNFVRFDPDWLTLTSREDDFSHGLDGWHVFKPFGPAVGFWRDRTAGPVLVEHPDNDRARALHLRRPDAKDPDGAVWNFPLGWKGRLTLRLRLKRGGDGASIALNDRMFEPTDDNGERLAVFRVTIDADGRLNGKTQLDVETWHELVLGWDLSAGSCSVQLDGQPVGSLEQANPTGNGICYLRLRSTAAKTDHAGFLVDCVRAEIQDPYAPPRTESQNRAFEKQYLERLKGWRNKTSE